MQDNPRPVYQTKGIVSTVHGTVMVKDIDAAQGRIQGYFAVFGNVDSDGDMIMPGAFKKTLQENGRRVKHLWQHNPLYPLSSPNVQEDHYGLLFDTTISKTSYGRDAIQLYVDGVVDEHSIGFQTVKRQKASGYTELQELKLWEGSTVTWGANERALVTGVKSLTKEQVFDRMGNVLKALRNGKYENEDIFDMLDLYFKQLQQHMLDLSTTSTPAADEAPEPQTGTKGLNVGAVLAVIHTLS